MPCGAFEESKIHILWDCGASRLIRKRAGGPSLNPNFFQGTIKRLVAVRIFYITIVGTWTTYFGIQPGGFGNGVIARL